MSQRPSKLADQSVVTKVAPNPLSSPEGAQDGCLVAIVGAEIGKRIPLGNKPLLLGRSSSADVQLDLENVSRHHARVERHPGGWLLRDLDSTNGTFVNERPVREHLLQDGDRIRIGRAVLKFLTSANVEAQYHEEIYRLMTIDGLTQVHNRRYFEEALMRELTRSQRYGNPFTLVLFDLDHFKGINDTHGHVAGDAVLRQVAALVAGNVRSNDVIARIGGEEFAVLLPETDRSGGLALAEKLRRIVEGHAFVYEDLTIQATLSAGVAMFELGLHSPEALLQAADERLYQSKRGGRNRVSA